MERSNVKEAIRELMRERGELTNRDIAGGLGLTRQAVHHHLQEMVSGGELALVGAGRGARYTLGNAGIRGLTFHFHQDTPELAWGQLVRQTPALQTLNADVAQVLACAVTEIVNNAALHSGAPSATLEVGQEGPELWVQVEDSGVGAFERLRQDLGLSSIVEAADQLVKGRVSSLPDHPGEGLAVIAFLAERLEIEANRFQLIFDNARTDIGFGSSTRERGTRIRWVSRCDRAVNLEDVFLQLGEHPPERCRARIQLSASGSDFVSRAEAQRVARGLERFSEVDVDFAGITAVGMGFLEVLFGDFPRAYPDIQLNVIHATPEIEYLIGRVLAPGDAGPGTPDH